MLHIHYFILAFIHCSYEETQPVFLIDYENAMKHLYIEPNPFAKMTSTEFADVIHEVIKFSETIILFVEDKLSPEDVSVKDNKGTPFHHLHQGLLESKVKYLPSVYDAFKILSQIFHPREYNVFSLTNASTKLQIFDTHYKYFYIYFQDGPNETRTESLRQHDLLMREVYFVMRQRSPGPVVAFYTGKVNTVVIDKVQSISLRHEINYIKENVKEYALNFHTKNTLFRLIDVFYETNSSKEIVKKNPNIRSELELTDEADGSMEIFIKLSFVFDLIFEFKSSSDHWEFTSVSWIGQQEDDVLDVMSLHVDMPWDTAYECNRSLQLRNKRTGHQVTISGYKVEVIKKNPIVEQIMRLQFSKETINCVKEKKAKKGGGSVKAQTEEVGSFSVPILSGLFVTSIWIATLMYGIVMLMNCHCNSKYDDPNGKPLKLAEDF